MSKLKQTHYDEVIRLYFIEGWSEERIGRKLGIGHTTVGRWVSSYADDRGKDRKVLREEMGGERARDVNAAVRAHRTLENKELRLLYRKLERARLQVTTLETMIRTLEAGEDN